MRGRSELNSKSFFFIETHWNTIRTNVVETESGIRLVLFSWRYRHKFASLVLAFGVSSGRTQSQVLRQRSTWRALLLHAPSNGGPVRVDTDSYMNIRSYLLLCDSYSYNASRLTEGILPAEPFLDFRQIVSDGYFSKLTTTTVQDNIPPRQNDVYWQNLNRSEDDLFVTVNDMERWRDRIISAIDKGYLVDVCI